MTGVRLQDPIWILFLVPLSGAMVLAARRRRRCAVLFSSLEGLRRLPITWAQRLKRGLPALRWTGQGLIVLALARPQRGREEFRVQTEGIAILMVLDRSGSMQALDFQKEGRRVDRLSIARDLFRSFVERRPDDLIGLITFGGFAESRCPLTLDHGVLGSIVDTVEVPKPLRDARGRVLNADLLKEEMATAIGDALALGVDRMKGVPARSKVMILLSDGENTAGVVDPLEAARAAQMHSVKVYTIGIGSTGPAPFPAEDLLGRPVLVSQEVRLDEEMLQKIAETTGGRAFNAKDTRALEEVYETIDRMERTPVEGRLYTEYRELYPWALVPGLALMLLDLVCGATRFRMLP